MRFFYIIFLLITMPPATMAEVSIRQTILLTAEEQLFLMTLIQENEEVQNFWYPMKEAAQAILDEQPQPLKVIYYEGLIDTNPKRIKNRTKPSRYG